MKKILSIGASNSETSINRKLAFWAASQVEGAEVHDVDLNDYEMPLFKVDREMLRGLVIRSWLIGTFHTEEEGH